MIEIRRISGGIEVYYNNRLIIDILEWDFGIEVYDYVNDTYLPVRSTYLDGVLEEHRHTIYWLLIMIVKNPENEDLDAIRKVVFMDFDKMENFSA